VPSPAGPQLRSPALPLRLGTGAAPAAPIPTVGKTLFEIAPPGVEDAILRSVDDEDDGWRIPVMNDYTLDTFFGEHGLSPGDRGWLRARGVGQPVGTYRDPAPPDLSALDALARTYIICAGDPGEPQIAPGTPAFVYGWPAQATTPDGGPTDGHYSWSHWVLLDRG
jgi:hypothetical protein